MRNLSPIPGQVVYARPMPGDAEGHQPIVDDLRTVFQHSPEVLWVGDQAEPVSVEMARLAEHVLARHGSLEPLANGRYRCRWDRAAYADAHPHRVLALTHQVRGHVRRPHPRWSR